VAVGASQIKLKSRAAELGLGEEEERTELIYGKAGWLEWIGFKAITETLLEPPVTVKRRMRLDEAPKGYVLFLNKQDDCVKVVLKPQT
jgi:threonine dehydrogenase-like Zn-dependent dehydrogenase